MFLGGFGEVHVKGISFGFRILILVILIASITILTDNIGRHHTHPLGLPRGIDDLQQLPLPGRIPIPSLLILENPPLDILERTVLQLIPLILDPRPNRLQHNLIPILFEFPLELHHLVILDEAGE